MFSFNSPQGMCVDCYGLGEIYTFDPEQLIPDPSRSFQQGCLELVGDWRGMGRWRRHIYRGVAEHLERKHGLAPGTVLETAWEELDPAIQQSILVSPYLGNKTCIFQLRLGEHDNICPFELCQRLPQPSCRKEFPVAKRIS